MRYWATPEHETRSRAATGYICSMMGADTSRSDEFVIEHQGRVIGKAGAWMLPDIAYILHPDYWRRGLMTEAMRVLIPHLFSQHNVPRLTAEVDPAQRGHHRAAATLWLYRNASRGTDAEVDGMVRRASTSPCHDRRQAPKARASAFPAARSNGRQYANRPQPRIPTSPHLRRGARRVCAPRRSPM